MPLLAPRAATRRRSDPARVNTPWLWLEPGSDAAAHKNDARARARDRLGAGPQPVLPFQCAGRRGRLLLELARAFEGLGPAASRDGEARRERGRRTVRDRGRANAADGFFATCGTQLPLCGRTSG